MQIFAFLIIISLGFALCISTYGAIDKNTYTNNKKAKT